MEAERRERYLRHILLKEVGAQGQQKLLAARVLVVGAGGLGSAIIPYLAAAGVGEIGVADDDVVALSNLQRQTIYRDEDIGARKAVCAAAFMRALNPDISATAICERLDAVSARGLFESYDLVVEGVDSFESRYALNDAAIATQTPLLYSAIGRFDGQVSVFKPWAGAGLPCYRCLAPEAPPREAVLTCAEEGVIGPVAGVVGAMAALEALKEILRLGEPLAGRLLIFDGFSSVTRSVRLPRDPHCAACGALDRKSGG